MTSSRDPLDRAAALVRSLRPSWRDATEFYEVRSEALDLLRRAASICAACPRRHAVPTRSRHAVPRAHAGRADPRAHDGDRAC